MLLTEEQLLQKKYDALVNQVVRWNESLTRTLVELEDSPKSFRKTMIDFSFAIDEVVKDAGFQPYFEGSMTDERKKKLMEELKSSEG